MKLQIAFRKSSAVFHDHIATMAVGVLEKHDETPHAYEEKMVSFRFGFDVETGLLGSVSCLDNPRDIVWEYGKEPNFESCTLEHLVTTPLHRSVPGMICNADLIFRATDVEPSEAGATVYAFSAIVFTPPSQKVDDTHVYQLQAVQRSSAAPMFLAGLIGETLRKEIGPIDVPKQMNGDALSSFLRTPWWGFGEEPVGLPGTMKRSVYHKRERYTELFLNESRSGDEDKEFDALREVMRVWGLNNIEKDPIYAKFIRARYEAVGSPRQKPQTGRETQDQEQALSVLVRSLINEDRTGMGL